jgi:oligoribonuclease NrnB/cAMP/cGMP phosphodiesterase (DHH superfamily)
VNLGSAKLIGVLEGDIVLDNIDYHKVVEVIYSLDGVTWQSDSAWYAKSIENNREVWSFSVETPEIDYMDTHDAFNFQFVIKYSVAGREYWDNNGGEGVDYRLSSEGANPLYAAGVYYRSKTIVTLVQGSKQSYRYGPYIHSFQGVAKSETAGGNESVTLVYSYDNWQTARTYECRNSNGNEWSWSIYFYGDHSSIEYAIAYELNEVTTWNNNYGEDFYFYLLSDLVQSARGHCWSWLFFCLQVYNEKVSLSGWCLRGL